MKLSTLLFAWFAVVVPLAAGSQDRLPDAPPGQVVACDLVDESTVTAIFGAPIQQRFPNRQTQAVDGAIHSICMFITARNNLKTLVFDFPNAADASRAFLRFTANGQSATFKSEAGLGDAASWWHIGSEAYGFTVRKGKRVYVLDTRWGDGKSEAGLKERLKPVVVLALRKL